MDNAGERKLDVDDDRIELAAAFTLWVHDATRNRSMIGMSRYSVIRDDGVNEANCLTVKFCLALRARLGLRVSG